VLDLLRSAGSGVHLDLKSQGAERPVAEALRRHGLVEQTVVSSFRPTTLRALHAVEPGLRLGRTYPQDRTGLTKRPVFQPPARAIVRVLRRALPRRIEALLAGSGATAAVLYWEVVSEAAVARCHALGAPVLVWTVDDAGLLPWLDEIGVDGVITNDPRIFRD
jgi:glycerophosphoryl diester phosphodiesterase